MRLARRSVTPEVTQEDLSARVGAYGVKLDRDDISKIETGDRMVKDYELLAIAAALYVPVSWLIGETELYGSEDDLPGRPNYDR
jgi:transcriptional regulator with XRE-family HTH domain